MTALQWSLVILAAGLGFAHIVTERRAPEGLGYFLKPAPILCLVLLVVFFAPEAPRLYVALLAGALLLSALGDVLLLDARRFAAGLVAFLLGHLLYIGAFSSQLDAAPKLVALMPLIFWGGVAFWLLRPGLGRLATPVVVYISVLMVMIWTAAEYASDSASRHASLAAIGALVFGVSDTLLALAKFRRSWPSAQILILATYYTAQILIAASAALYIAGD